MARYRFPGKALKLSNRKRVKFRNWDRNTATEDQYSRQIVKGYELFRNLFGASEEDADDFEGFNDDGTARNLYSHLPTGGDLEFSQQNHSLRTSTKHDHITGTAKRKVGRPCKQKTLNKFEVKNNIVNSVNARNTSDTHSLKENAPTVTIRPSRIIKPIKRLVEDDSYYDNNIQDDLDPDCDDSGDDTKNLLSSPPNKNSKRPVGRPRRRPLSPPGYPSQYIPSPDPTIGGDKVSRNISLYADSISSHVSQGVGRPVRRGHDSEKSNFTGAAGGQASNKVQEKIEKLLQSPWDGRVKQAAMSVKTETNSRELRKASPLSSGVAVSKNILRKARLHLNKHTLQKIRNPVSVQHLLLQPGDDTGTGSCGVCQLRGKYEHLYGIACCLHCANFMTNLSEKPPVEDLICHRGYGGCQLVGISVEERCMACWLLHTLLSCTLPSLMHDRLRKKLPQHLKQRVPTSLARSVYYTEMSCADNRGPGRPVMGGVTRGLKSSTDLAGMFGSIVDLPGGWKRKTGPEPVVISPSGEKFKSIPKLEEYLSNLGINADARVLFGGGAIATSSIVFQPSTTENTQSKSKKREKRNKHKSRTKNKEGIHIKSSNNSVITTLPGGWVRRTKFRNDSTRNRFDVYVYSPDGRTFRSKKQLSAYFQRIGKVDDILKYFPLFHETGSQMATSREHTETESSTEPDSSSELCTDTDAADVISDIDATGVISDVDDDDGVISDVESRVDARPSIANDTHTWDNQKTSKKLHENEMHAKNYSFDATSTNLNNNSTFNLSVASEEASQEFIGFDSKTFVKTNDVTVKLQIKGNSESICTENVSSIISRVSKSFNSSSCDNNSSESVSKVKRSAINIQLPNLAFMNLSNEKGKIFSHEVEMKKLTEEQVAEDILSRDKERDPNESSVVETVTSCTDQKAADDSDLLILKLPKVQANANSSEAQSHESNGTSEKIILEKTKVIDSTKRPVESKEENTRGEVDSAVVREVKASTLNFKAFQTQHLIGGWSRKIKWNQNGVGKVSFVVTPSGSKIHSMIELQAYFKKEGAPTADASYYFPNQLDRKDVPEKVIPTPRVLKSKSIKFNKVIKKDTDNNGQTRSLDLGGDGEALAAADTRGPRIKRVCRSLEQALGMPRAIFPAPDEKETREVLQTEESDCTTNESSAAASDAGLPAGSEKPKMRKTAKVYSVMTTATGKILRKTQWCNRCSGCLIPNCRKCYHCMDMVKYGGPGTKKKPCIQRKCINPRLSVHSTHKPSVVLDPPIQSTTSSGTRPSSLVANEPTSKKKMPNIKVTKRQTKKMAEMQRRAEKEVIDQEQASSNSSSAASAVSDACKAWEEARLGGQQEQEKIVFVPRQMGRPLQEVKERADAAVIKSVVPGALVNIDYWQGYDTDAVLQQGFPVLQAAPLHLTALCFRCGSAGKEEMLWCSWCCEGVHPYCLEEGEGPGSSREASCWVCRRCAVCHVCGSGATVASSVTAGAATGVVAGADAEALLRCSACLYYYHLECLGPGAHDTCTPPNDALWEREMMRHLQWSWPLPPPIFRIDRSHQGKEVSGSAYDQLQPHSCAPQEELLCGRHESDQQDYYSKEDTETIAPVVCVGAGEKSQREIVDLLVSFNNTLPKLHSSNFNDITTRIVELDTTLLTVLESGPDLCQQSELGEPLCFLLPRQSTGSSAKKEELPLELPEVTCVADVMEDLDLMEMDGIDLDAIIDGLDEVDDECSDYFDSNFDDNDVVEVYTDVDLDLPMKTLDISQGGISTDVVSMHDDEYLSLGYKKITIYPSTRFELSSYRLLQMVHTEHFIALGCLSLKQLEARKLVRHRLRGRRKIPHCEVISDDRYDSETDTASEGETASDSESDFDWEDVLEIRRFEAQQEMKERMEKKDQEQKRLKELELEKEKQNREKNHREKMRKKFNRNMKRKKLDDRRASAEQDEDDEIWTPIPKKKKKKKELKLKHMEADDTEDERIVNWDDEVYFRQPSDSEDKLSAVARRKSRALLKWQPKNFAELDALFDSRHFNKKGSTGDVVVSADWNLHLAVNEGTAIKVSLALSNSGDDVTVATVDKGKQRSVREEDESAVKRYAKTIDKVAKSSLKKRKMLLIKKKKLEKIKFSRTKYKKINLPHVHSKNKKQVPYVAETAHKDSSIDGNECNPSNKNLVVDAKLLSDQDDHRDGGRFSASDLQFCGEQSFARCSYLPEALKVTKKKNKVISKSSLKSTKTSSITKDSASLWPTLTRVKQAVMEKKGRALDECSDQEACFDFKRRKPIVTDEKDAKEGLGNVSDAFYDDARPFNDTNNSDKENKVSSNLMDSLVDATDGFDVSFVEDGNDNTFVIEVLVNGDISDERYEEVTATNQLPKKTLDDVCGTFTKSSQHFSKPVLCVQRPSSEELSLDIGNSASSPAPSGSDSVEDSSVNGASSKRSSRRVSHGRASELASMRKAMMDM